MDTKEKWLLQHTLEILKSGSFSERDVLILLILLREHADKYPLIREFGDFIAHRERDRGIWQRLLCKVQYELNKPQSTNPIESSIYTQDEVYESLNNIFGDLDLSLINAELANQITVCIISLLQSVPIKIKDDKLGTMVVNLSVEMSPKQIALFGQVKIKNRSVIGFPLLVAHNNNYEYSLSISPNVASFISCDFIVEAYCSAGQFKAEQTPQRVA